jgi:hypothetical protein
MHMQNSQQGIVWGTSAEHRKVIDLRYFFLEGFAWVTRQLDQGVFGGIRSMRFHLVFI